MSYLFKGNLRGAFCGDCEEAISTAVVRLYRHRQGDNVTALAVAKSSDTLALLDDAAVAAKASLLIAEAKTDANGDFAIELDARQKYDGGAFQLDVYCESVPLRRSQLRATPRQFSITTLQPAWKASGENAFVAVWRYSVPNRFWCYLRGLFDAWVICGHLKACDDGSPIPGATVSAFDVDWLQDDPLGSAVTDATGHFRIDYASAAFKLTPFSPLINFEWTGGPDVYFKAAIGSDLIIDEPRSTGRSKGRENIGPCFCVELCTDKVHGGGQEAKPHWMQLSDFDIHPDAGQVGSQFSAEGYAGGAAQSYVFGGNVPLHGNCPLTNEAAPANALQYRFVIGEYTWPGGVDDPTTLPAVVPAAMLPLLQIAPIQVGWVYYQDAFNVYSWQPVYVTAADLDGQGWIKPVLGRSIPTDMHDGTTGSVVITTGNFLRNNNLAAVDTAAVTAGLATPHPPHLPSPPGLPKSQAGRSLTLAEREPVRRYKLRFEVRDAVTLAAVYADTLTAVIFDNSNIVVALDLEELRSNLCNPLGGATQVHVLYTVDHPHLRNFSLSISNNGGVVHGSPPMPSGSFLPGPNFFFRGGAGGPHNVSNTGGFAQDVSMDGPCAYRVSLGWQTRHYTALPASTEILYCK